MTFPPFFTAQAARLRFASFATAFVCLTPVPPATAQVSGATITAVYNGTEAPQQAPVTGRNGVRPALVGANPVSPVLSFPSEPVGTQYPTAQPLTLSWTVTSPTMVTPTASIHYGIDYHQYNPISCTGSAPTYTCSMSVYFAPGSYTGMRKDAIFLSYSGSRLSTVLLSGIATGPLGALQGGVLKNSSGISSLGNGHYSAPVTDDQNHVYFFYNNNLYVSSYLNPPTLLMANATSGDVNDLAIDGAGVLYWGLGTQSPGATTTINTYDTVQSVSGTLTMPASDLYYSVATDGLGDVFGIGATAGTIYKVTAGGTQSSAAIAPAIPSPYHSATDAAGDLFVGASTINELTAGGAQSQVSTAAAASGGMSTDAAGTLLVSNGTGSTAELPPSNYNAQVYSYSLIAAIASYGSNIASDGTIYFGTGGGIDVIDRTQNPLAFNNQTLNTATTQTVNVINIGNVPLTYSSIVVTGTGFSLGTAGVNPCGSAITLAAGASCNLAVTFQNANAGSFTGTVTLTSNALNVSGTTQTIPLTAFIHGPYLTAAPSSVTFPSQTIATTSSTLYVTITNNGYDSTAGLTFISSNPAFTAATGTTNSPCTSGENLPGPGQSPFYSCQLALTFTPTLTQNYTGTITVTGGGGAYANSVTTISVSGNGAPVVTQTAGGTGKVITFNNAAVGVAQASAQTITASFLITGETTLINPIASLHYGTSYSAGAVTCTGSIGAQTCSVPITFVPSVPGGRKDAVFLTAGGVRIATALIYGVGTAPFALIQPGVITNPISSGGYYYGSIVDENGTVYTLESQLNAVLATTKAGVSTVLPITELNSPREIAIDGAGVLYIADQTSHGVITTYDTVLGIQGSVPWSSAEPGYNQGVAIGNTGNMYLTDSTNIYTIPLYGSGTAKTTAVSPANTQNSDLIVDSLENVFDQGYAVNELTPAGVQTQVNTTAGNSGFAVDAAGTLYSGRYGTGGIGMLAASNYAAAVAYVDGSKGVEGVSVGSDGTVYAGDYTSIDKIDRSQGLFTFNSLNANQVATPQVATIYNGGNMPLTITSTTLTGDPNYNITANTCVSATIQPGGVCTFTVNFTAPHQGVFNGSIAIVSNSLNATTSQTLALTDTVSGGYLTVSPTTLNFGTVPLNTASAPMYITYSNSGANAVDIEQAGTNNGRFQITIPPACANIPVGGSCQLAVVFTPTAPGLLNASGGLSVAVSLPLNTANAPNTPAQVILTGTGGPAAAPILTLTPATIAFGNQQENAGGTIPGPPAIVQISNTGNASMTLNGYSITGSGSANFQVLTAPTNPCTPTIVIAAGASCNVEVVFQPFGNGAYSVSFTAALYGNAANSPQSITLTGTGVLTPQLQFNPAQLTAIAGTGTVTVNGSGDNGSALAATFNQPFGIAQDQSGNTYISDYGANYVRKIAPNGTITQYAGLVGYSNHGFSGDTGPATAAQMFGPQGLAVDSAGNLYIADEYNGRVRVVNAATGVTSTYAGTGIGSYTPGANALSTKLPGPVALAFDPSGNLYIAMGQNASIVVKVTPFGTTSLYAGVMNGAASVQGYNGDNILATAADLNDPSSVATDLNSNVYIADYGNSRVRKITATTGIITSIAGNGSVGNTGDGAAAVAAEINPLAVAVNLAGDVYIAVANAALNAFSVRKINQNGLGTITTVVGGGTGGLGAAAASANLNYVLEGIAVDINGSLLIATNGPAQVLSAGPSGFLQFPSQTVGTTSTQQNIAFENTGSGILVPSPATYTATGPFSVTPGGCAGDASIAAGQSGLCFLGVTFTPTAATTQTGSIIVASNGSIPSQTIFLQGTGTPGAVPQESLTPTGLNFANTPVNSTATAQTVTLSNGGNATLTGIAVSITGANPADFAETTTCGTTLNAGANCPITVTFTPLSAATFNANVTVTSALGSVSTTLTGTGTAPQASISGALTFPSTAVNATATAQTVTLTNAGNAPLPITSVSIPNYEFSLAANTCGNSLAAASSCTYSITFTPNANGPQASTLSVLDSVGTQTVSLTGTGVGTPAVAYSPGSLTFSTAVNTTATAQVITVTNSGTAPLTGPTASITGSSFNISATTCTGSLAVNATCTVSVTFSPLSATTVTATLSLADNAGNSPQTVSLSGTGTAPSASAGPSSLTFSSTAVGSTAAAQIVTLNNSGSAALAITSATTSAQFAISANTCGASLPANSTCTYSVTFTPTAAGTQTGSLTIVDAVGTQTVSLSGTGTAPQASLTSSITFPSTNVGATAAAMTLTLTNAGNAALAITNTAFSGSQFALTANTCNASLAANSSCTYTFTFTPSAAGAQTTTFTVNDAVGTQSATLTGIGVGIAQAVISPTTLTFPSASIGASSAAQTITISNPGTAPLTLSGYSLTGANPANFVLTSTCSLTIAVNGSCTISVIFTPTSATNFTASVIIADSAAGSPQTVALTGSGNAFTDFGVTTQTTPQSVDPGGAAVYTINVTTLTGNFTTPVTLTATGMPTGATASFAPTTVTPGLTGAPSTLTIQTSPNFAGLAAALQPNLRNPAWAALLLLPLLGTRRLRRKLPGPRLLGLLLLSLAALLPLSGCGGGYFGAAPSTYTITVIGSSTTATGTVTHSTTVTLNLQ